MDMSFRDHFSSHSSFYSEFRPGYPKDLFYYLKNLSPHGKTVWDCGTGTGQAAVPLGELFEKVIASDPSENQIVNAEPRQNVEYRVCKAENSTLGNHEVDLITVAQAFHWFDFNPFYKEVIRVGKKKGILAIWGYGLHSISSEIDGLVNKLYGEIVGPYWPSERKYVEEKYKTIPFPFEEIVPPHFSMKEEWNVDQLLGYLRTWSSVQKYIQKNESDPVLLVEEYIRNSWGPTQTKIVEWPLFFKIGRLPD
ncbi:class I SAM-dependent methyltransferase [Leptospira interrogans]|uniref:Methyltransferase domain protein n=3 Tax=Leptospira interrogans TaxID=173 RepID=A0A0E2CZG3_LEPIR|nr:MULTISPECIES: class I SAM-dependent methyltransferase [Leptospira]AJR16289.1 methyltransferase domain protein [Leptospira interrogans serovar Linhai str. 56609]ASV07942.1 class I SAM-dependent methyltransferase [Leptospira interrogans serovar Canicola]ASV10428.1 class I SAM-dependent methyltransferase [Leptospira interrogans serovar Canicola]EJO78628.1 methyltransferase domain protein [Leptospira interrogans serovar Pomona str. Kennewicki LC82-25]EKN95307.1 methyltransferase domain protein 